MGQSIPMLYVDVISALRTSRDALFEATEACPPARHSAAPGPDRWAVLDVLDHIELTDARMFSFLDRLLQRALRQDRLEAREMVEVPVSLAYRDAIPVYNAVAAFPGTEPSGRTESDIRAGMERSDSVLTALIESGGKYDCIGLVAPHPIGRLNYYEWLYLRAEHDRLHTEQITEIVASL